MLAATRTPISWRYTYGGSSTHGGHCAAGGTDAPRALFARLHGLSTALHAIPLLGGLVLLAWEMQD